MSGDNQIEQRYDFFPDLNVVGLLSHAKCFLKGVLEELGIFQPPIRGPSQLIKGIEMLMYGDLPADQDGKGVLRGKAAGMGPDIAWFKDPSGNVLSVLEE